MNTQFVSDIFLENGNYVKLQHVNIGYDFKRLWYAMPFGQFRLSLQANNLFTFTKYSGMDPEIGFSDLGNQPDGQRGWMAGVDLGYYPSAKSFMVGLNVTF